MTHTINRRRALQIVAAVPVVAAVPAAAVGTRVDLLGQVRAFADELSGNVWGFTLGEWVERKRIANMLRALIGDAPEPWEQWEADLLAERARTRTGPIWGRS